MDHKKEIMISFCLPVYNVEYYLDDCLESIIAQGLDIDQYEILCVDDASQDQSLVKIKDWVTKHSQIRVVSNEINRGVSYTRNVAVDLARGKYIWFVDPDDMLLPNVALGVLEYAERYAVDALLGNYIRVDEKTRFADLSDPSNNRQDVNVYACDFNDSMLPKDDDNVHMCAVWAGVFRREAIVKTKLRFNECMSYQEDTLFYFEMEQRLTNVLKKDVALYAYRNRTASAMNTNRGKRAKQYYSSVKCMYDVYMMYYKNKLFKDERRMHEKLHHVKESCILCLAQIPDTEYVKQEISELRRSGVWPYPFRTACLHNKRSAVRNLTIFLLPLPLFFWCMHYALKVKMKRQ